MTEEELDSLIKKLSWNYNDRKEQKKAIYELINQVDNKQVKKLIQPKGKEYWENASKVLKQIDKNIISEVNSELLVWLQDLNWPGALNILNLFEKMESNYLEEDLNNMLRAAERDEDDIWIENLQTLKERNKMYFDFKRIIEEKFKNEIWKDGYIRIDSFIKRRINQNVCRIYLSLFSCEDIVLEFRGHIPIYKLNTRFKRNCNYIKRNGYNDVFIIRFNIFDLKVLEYFKYMIRTQRYTSGKDAWTGYILDISITEVQKVCENYIDAISKSKYLIQEYRHQNRLE